MSHILEITLADNEYCFIFNRIEFWERYSCPLCSSNDYGSYFCDAILLVKDEKVKNELKLDDKGFLRPKWCPLKEKKE